MTMRAPMEHLTTRDADQLDQWTESPDAADRPFGAALVLRGFAIIVIFLGGLAIWSLLAPIESAVVAPGVVSVDTNRKTVQHLEGGIVKSIDVREGDRVTAGQVLIRLQDTVGVSVLNQLQAQYFEARAIEARLVAERDGKSEIAFPDELMGSAAEKAARTAIAGQRSVFDSRRKLLAERLAILGQQIARSEDEIVGLKGQVRASRKQIALIEEELVGVTKLFEKKLIPKPRLLALKRRKAEIEGEISERRASIARANEGVQESRLRMAELQASATTEVVEQLRAVSARAYDLGQRLAAAKDVLSRTTIRSPIDGIVVGLDVHTLGGVIAAGQRLLDIVPSHEKLVVQASIDPRDIDQVHVGLPAHVKLTALNRRNQTPIDGEVNTVSADRFTDPQTGAAYYLARVELNADSPGLMGVTLQPGMSTDVMIRTGARTPVEYLMAPITRYLDKALREK